MVKRRPGRHSTEAAREGPRTLEDALRDKIRELLTERGWSQQTLAHHLDLTQATVSTMLSGRRRGEALRFYQRLAAVFGVKLSRLIQELETRVEVVTRTRAPRQRPVGEGVVDVVAQDEETRRQQEEADRKQEELRVFAALFHKLLDRELDREFTRRQEEFDAQIRARLKVLNADPRREE